ISMLQSGDGQAGSLTSHIEDITDKKQALESLCRSEEKYRRLVANLPDATWSSNQNGETSHASPNIEAISGYSLAEVYEGGRELWSTRIHPSDNEKVSESYRALFVSGLPFDLEYRI